jgi:hypothetical protein
MAQDRASTNQSVVLAQDDRHSRPINLSVTAIELRATLEQVTRELGVQLHADAKIARRRISLKISQQPASKVMTAIAKVTGLEWERKDGGYRLYQTDEAEKEEKRLIAISEKREEAARNAKIDGLLKSVQQAVAARTGKGDSVADLLATLSPEQLRNAAEIAAEPEGIIAADNQSAFHSKFISPTPFTQLSPKLQRGVAAMVGSPKYERDNMTKGASSLQELSRSQVGIIAASGAMRLGLVNPDGKDVWVSSFDDVHRRGIAGVDADLGMPSEVEEEFQRSKMLDLADMPADIRKSIVRFDRQLDRSFLTTVLEAFSAQTHIGFVSDDFLHSRRTPYPWTLTDREEYTVEQALEQIANSYLHKITYRNGMLEAVAIGRGLDLRAEAPAEIIDMMRARTKEHKGLTFDDYLALGRLSHLQVFTMRIAHIEGVDRGMLWKDVDMKHHLFAAVGALTDEERTRAESGEGMPLGEIKIGLRPKVLRLAETGLPGKITKDERPTRAGLFIRRSPMGESSEKVVILVASANLKQIRRYEIVARRNAAASD